MTRYTLKIESDEDGFTLVIGSDIDPDRYRFPIEDPEALYDTVKAEIGPWLYERDMAKSTRTPAAFKCDPDESGGQDEYVVAVREDGSYRVEPDEDAYDPTDPKHPDYHSIHADHYDNREKV